MRRISSFSILTLLVLTSFSVLANATTAPSSHIDYIPIDVANAPRYDVVVEGAIEPRSHHSYWQIGDYAYWLAADFYAGYYFLAKYQLRAIGNTVEIWVQENMSWPEGDPRSYPTILDEQIQYLLNEFDNKIYPIDTEYFGVPDFHNGSYAVLPEWVGLPGDYYYEENGRSVILVSNIKDENYYNSSYPYYIAGFYSSAYESFFDRNVITIDCYAWEYRVGPLGYEWISGVNVTRPYVYEATIAHEYQHLIHDDYNPDDDTFMNEGCSMYAELLCGYGIDPAYLNSYFATPDNSLTVWGDQGDINILADYGAAALWTVYLSDHYGGAALISYFVRSGVPGIEGINNALAHFGYKERFEDVFLDWRLANLIRSDHPGSGKYNYKSLNLNSPEITPVRIYEVGGMPFAWMKGTEFGNTTTILGYDTGVSKIGPFGTDYIALVNWTRPGFIHFDGDDVAQYGWELTAEGYWWSGAGNLLDASLEAKAYVSPDNPVLTLETKYGIEDYWDFGFVQVSTDGITWTSLANEYTTYDHDPDAHPDIVANLPGLTGYNPDWPNCTIMSFNLTAYAGQNITVRFRYMTDWATIYEGWYIKSANVSGTPLTLTPVYPEADFQVTIVLVHEIYGKTLYIPIETHLNDQTEEGISLAAAKSPSYAILIVSPTMHEGFADYQFKTTYLPH